MIAQKARFRSIRKIERLTGYHLPDQAFSGTVLEAITSRVNFTHLDHATREQVLGFIHDFCRCPCHESPFCGCPEQNFATAVLDLREQGLDHRQISSHLLDEYGIALYPADILSFLEESVHVLEAVRDIAELQGKDALASSAKTHIADISR